MRSVKDLLETDYGLSLTGWTLEFSGAISDDGLTIVGVGKNPSGNAEAWIAVIPEPSTALLVAVGLAGIAWTRGRRG
jgi:hypothetical protein